MNKNILIITLIGFGCFIGVTGHIALQIANGDHIMQRRGYVLPSPNYEPPPPQTRAVIRGRNIFWVDREMPKRLCYFDWTWKIAGWVDIGYWAKDSKSPIIGLEPEYGDTCEPILIRKEHSSYRWTGCDESSFKVKQL